MRIYLTGQNNFGNRGCEALVRTTVAVLRELAPGTEFLVPSLEPALDQAQWPDAAASGVRFVLLGSMPGRFIQWSRVCSRLPALSGLGWPSLRPGESPPGLSDADAVWSIGGDNYSLDYDLASLAYFVAVGERAMALGLPAVLWGASVGPFRHMPAVERHMTAHLRRLQAITVREHLSREYLQSLGVHANVIETADSAFLLDSQPWDLRPMWPQDDGAGVIGFNLSPLVDRQFDAVHGQGAMRREVTEFIRELVRMGCGVLLIPHVEPLREGGAGADHALLQALAEQLTDLGARVRMLPRGLNACQTKHAIRQCRLLVAARTHATIASMSSGVPTLSIAYSVKAHGINAQVYGHTRYVLDAARCTAPALMRLAREMLQAESEIGEQSRARCGELRALARAASLQAWQRVTKFPHQTVHR